MSNYELFSLRCDCELYNYELPQQMMVQQIIRN